MEVGLCLPSMFPSSVSPIVSLSCFPTMFSSFLLSHVAKVLKDWTLLLEVKNLSIAPSDLYINTVVLTCVTCILSLYCFFDPTLPLTSKILK